MQTPEPTMTTESYHEVKVDPADLQGNRAWAPALYAEGWLSGVKGTDSGFIDYILACFIPNKDLSDTLFAAYDAFTNGDQMKGYELLEKTKPLFDEAMVNCPDSQAEFDRIDQLYQDILSRPDASEIQKQNYKDNKETIDADVKQAVVEWNKPSPTNAGRLAGEVMALVNGRIDDSKFL